MSIEPWRTGKVIKIEQQTHNTRRFFIEVPELEVFDYKPGQFVTLDLPINEKPNRRWRSYSIASWPDGTNVFELCIVLLDGGAGTTYLFNEIIEGSEITLRGPVGIFSLQPVNYEKELFLICTGTGIAPFRSMVQYIKLHKIPHQNIHLIFGCRTQQDLLYFDELTQLQNELDNFNFHPVLSREQWNGKSGYVHAIYEEVCASKLPATFFLCGWKAMIDEAKQRIIDMGYDRKLIHQELYG